MFIMKEILKYLKETSVVRYLNLYRTTLFLFGTVYIIEISRRCK